MTDGRIDGHMDRQTDESGFIGRCPTDAERPKDTKTMNKTSSKSIREKRERCHLHRFHVLVSSSFFKQRG